MKTNTHCYSEFKAIKRAFFLVLALFIMGLASSLQAQDQDQDEDLDTYQRSSPYHTIYTFLDNLQPDNYHPSISAKTIDFPRNYTNKQKEDLAIQLKQYLDGKGLYIELDELPRESNYIDTNSNRNQYILAAEVPEIFVQKVGDVWLFSTKTVRAIPTLHSELYPYGLNMLVGLFPQANKRFLGLTTWQYISLFILFVLTIVLQRLLTFFFGVFLQRFLTKISHSQAAQDLIKSIARPASLAVLVWILSTIVPALGLPVILNWLLLSFINISLPIFIIIICLRLTDFAGYYMSRMAERTSGTLDDQLIPLLRKAMKIIIVVVGFLYILSILNFSIENLVGGLAIGSLAFALAAQDTIKNLFGSITIFLDRPFQVGDWVVAPGINGSIEEVGFRSTRVRTFHDSQIYIPNGKLADMTIDNMGLRSYRRFRTMLALTYDTPPALINAFIDGVRQIVLNHPHTRKDNYHVYLNEFNSASLDVLLYTFFDVPTWGEELKTRHEVMVSIIELADELGVRFAFPTQTIHIEDLPGQKGLTPDYADDYLQADFLDKKVDSFISSLYQRQARRDRHIAQTKQGGEDGGE